MHCLPHHNGTHLQLIEAMCSFSIASGCDNMNNFHVKLDAPNMHPKSEGASSKLKRTSYRSNYVQAFQGGQNTFWFKEDLV